MEVFSRRSEAEIKKMADFFGVFLGGVFFHLPQGNYFHPFFSIII